MVTIGKATKWNRDAKENNLCYSCHAPRDPSKSRCTACLEKERIKSFARYHEVPELKRRQWQAYRRRLRERVLVKYGGRCQCCGVSNYEFLSIDHKFGGGAHERAQLKTSLCLYRKLDRMPVSNEYQVLCFNCNLAKGFFGVCPHERELLVQDSNI